MKHRYSAAQLAKHGLLFPLRILPHGRLMSALWKAILRYQNSVPLYLVLKSGDVAVQIGTPNVHSVRRFSKLVGARGRVLIVEADPDNAMRLRKSLAFLKHQNVTLVNKGAWSSAGVMPLRKSREFDGDHRFDTEGVFVDNDMRTIFEDSVSVEMAPLDDIAASSGIGAVNYLSVTVNGAELEVLRGSRRLLASSSDLVVFSKGHGRIGSADGVDTLNTSIQSYLDKLGFISVISRGEMSPTGESGWGRRSGDVFAWKEKE